MKKYGLFAVLFLIVIVLILTGCIKSTESTLSTSSTVASSDDTAPSVYTSATDTSFTTVPVTYHDLDHIDFNYFSGKTFWFMSGAGGWQTYVQIQPDGSFAGHYHAPGAECSFNGQFTSLKKISEFEFSMKCASLKIKGTLGAKKKVDGVEIETVKPFGFYNANLFNVYLPGKKLAELPLEFKQWVRVPWEYPGTSQDPNASQNYQNWVTDYGNVFKAYGLYNVNEKEGFIAQDPFIGFK